MSYSIRGLTPEHFDHLRHASDTVLASHDSCRMTADAVPGFPCRITLDDAALGETLILTNHVSQAGGAYRASHAIFVSESAREAAYYVDEVPPALYRRLLSLRAFDAAGMMVDAALTQPGEADPVIRRMLADPAVDHLDAHNAVRGCFAARVERT